MNSRHSHIELPERFTAPECRESDAGPFEFYGARRVICLRGKPISYVPAVDLG